MPAVRTAVPAPTTTIPSSPRTPSGQSGMSGKSAPGGTAPKAAPPPAPKARPRLDAVRAQAHAGAQAADGLLFGMVCYAVAINYMRGGWTGVEEWLKAKFLNEPTQGKTTQGKGVNV